MKKIILMLSFLSLTGLSLARYDINSIYNVQLSNTTNAMGWQQVDLKTAIDSKSAGLVMISVRGNTTSGYGNYDLRVTQDQAGVVALSYPRVNESLKYITIPKTTTPYIFPYQNYLPNSKISNGLGMTNPVIYVSLTTTVSDSSYLPIVELITFNEVK